MKQGEMRDFCMWDSGDGGVCVDDAAFDILDAETLAYVDSTCAVHLIRPLKEGLNPALVVKRREPKTRAPEVRTDLG